MVWAMKEATDIGLTRLVPRSSAHRPSVQAAPVQAAPVQAVPVQAAPVRLWPVVDAATVTFSELVTILVERGGTSGC